MLAGLRNSFTTDLRRIDWKRTILLVLLILAVFAALWQYLMPQIRTIESTTFKRVPEIKKVKEVQRVYIKCPERGIVVLDKEQVAKKLDTDQFLQVYQAAPADQPDQSDQAGLLRLGPAPEPRGLEVTATAEIPQCKNGAQALSVIDMNTGQSTIVVKENVAPWFQFRNDGAVGIRYGLNQHLQYVGNVYGKWDFLRVKDVFFSLGGDLETGGDAQLQVGSEYRW